MSIIPYESGGHWYAHDGSPRFDADLRVARKEKLKPSVTTALKVVDKPQVVTFKCEQAVILALKSPWNDGEDPIAFAKRVVADMNRSSSVAASFGTAVHAEIERFNKTGVVEGGDLRYRPWLHSYVDWFEYNVGEIIHSERSITSLELGYAGTIDLEYYDKQTGLYTLADVKTQGFKKGKVNFYDEWVMQLAAYWRLVHPTIEGSNMKSLAIDSKEVSPVKEKLWTQEQAEQGWLGFCAAFDLWRVLKKYDPREAA
jgi:hypothetical protein